LIPDGKIRIVEYSGRRVDVRFGTR